VIVHGNTLGRDELAWLAQQGMGLVHCPQSARWFGHPQLDVDTCVQLGVKLCLGTDSLASAESLSIWDQLREFHGKHPRPMESLLALVTRVPGEVLAEQESLGVLRAGACADFIVLKTPEGFAGADWSWLLDPDYCVQQVFINGTRRNINA
jgi:cytosine/adenosine deaminase-related metal-dependent hydrolase